MNQPVNLGAQYAKQILNEEYTSYFVGAQDVDSTIAKSYTRLDKALQEFRK